MITPRETLLLLLMAVGCDALDAKPLAVLGKSLGAFFTGPDRPFVALRQFRTMKG
jgi:hypothetical protein